MAITNAMIIFNASQQLLADGKLKPTGRMMEFETPEGEVMMVPEAEAIHTYEHWKEIGYQVRKGEKAVASFQIWKYTKKGKEMPEDDAQEKGFCFMKTAFWFSQSQVDRVG